MSQSLSTVYLHLIFSTKDRRPFLNDDSIRGEAHAYLGGISKQMDCTPVIIGGVEDHVHILAQQSRTAIQYHGMNDIYRTEDEGK